MSKSQMSKSVCENEIKQQGTTSVSKTNTSSMGSRPECPGGKGTVSNPPSTTGFKMKKMFHKFKERAHLTQKTEYSKALNDAFDEIDNYKLCLDELAERITCTVQQNAQFRNLQDPQMQMEAPPRRDPYEEVEDTLKECEYEFSTFTNYQPTIKNMQKLAGLHREYVNKSRKAVHSIRTFIKHDYWVIGIERKELERCRSEMDFSKDQLKANKDATTIQLRTTIYEEAVKAFDIQMRKVTEMMDTLPKHKESHSKDVIDLVEAACRFHEKAAMALKA